MGGLAKLGRRVAAWRRRRPGGPPGWGWWRRLVPALSLWLAVMVAPVPIGAQAVSDLHFGCNPGPVLPPTESQSLVDEEPELPEPDFATLYVGRGLGRPIDGTGFNLEHALWSCRRFRAVFDDEIVRPFRPAVVRFDLSPFPLAGADAPPEALTFAAYQAALDSPLYAQDWEMLRRVDQSGARILLGIWGVPGALTVDGYRRGPLAPEHYDDYVEYAAAGIDYLVRRQGIRIWATTIMNEPDGGDGSQLSPEGLVEVARRLGRRLAPYGVRLYGPDTTNAEHGYAYAAALLADPEARGYLATVATHQYYPSGWTAELAELAAAHGLPLYVTEFTSFDYGDLDTGIVAADELGFTLAATETLAAHVMDGAQAAIYWDAVDYLQANYQTITRWGVLEGPREGFTRRHRYYGLLQLMRYLRPGSRPLETTFDGPDTVRVLATVLPGGRGLVIAFVNRGGPTRVTLAVDPAWTAAGSRLRAYRTSRSEAMARLDPVDLEDGRAEFWLPARTITTLVRGERTP